MGSSLPTIFLLGPSGTGKSTFGEYLRDQHNWLFLEADRLGEDGMAALSLAQPWSEFYNSFTARPLATELMRRREQTKTEGCIVTFPGNLVLEWRHIEEAHHEVIAVACLYGSAADCMNSFLSREHSNGRHLDVNHWLSNNYRSYFRLSLPELATVRVTAFNQTGTHRDKKDILEDIFHVALGLAQRSKCGD